MTDEEYKKWLSDTPEKQLARQTEELLATAKANDSKERGKTALTALDKLLKLDPYHAEARLLRSKIAAYYGPTALMVPDQYPTIREAMDAANSGDTVMVKPGIYRDAITFKEGIRLLGTDRGACRIEPVDGALAVITAVACRSGSIENLTLDGRDALLSHRYEIGVQCEDKDGGVWIRQVVEGTPAAIAGIRAGARIAAISGRPIRNVSEVNLLVGLLGRLDGITVELKGAGAEGHRSVIVNPEKMEVSGGYRPDGIALLDCQIEVRDCVVQGIGTGILATGPYSSPVLRGNQCRTNNRHGIVIASSGVVERNICEGNKFTGILAGGVGIRPTIMGNTCRSNGQHGILFTSACGTAEDNTCDENKCSGIVTLDMGAAPMIRRNRCRSNGLHGIEFSQKGGGTAEGNTSEGNTYCGIIVFGAGSAPTLIGNQCRSNKFGIAFSNGSGGIAQGNQCDNNSEWGIWYDGGAQPSIAADNAAFGNAKGQIKR
jgi:parallel beta-helix repeat protein